MSIFLSIGVILIPLSMVLYGTRWSKKPPQKNGFLGYRTVISKQSQEAWEHANKYWGKMARKAGGLLEVATLIFLIYTRERPDFGSVVMYWLLFQLVVELLVAICTEVNLHKTFTKSGERKELK